MKTSIGELASLVGGAVVGDPSVEVSGISSLELAGPEHITFVAHPRHTERLKTSRAAAVIVSDAALAGELPKIVVGSPYLAYAQVAAFFHPGDHAGRGVAPDAFVHADARLGEDVSVYPLVWVDRGAEIGNRVTLYPGVCVGEGCVIGDDSVLYPRVVLYPGSRLGRRVVIHAGSVIGSDGFGYARDGERSVKIPQLGGVLIEDDVEIGANCAIDRASFAETRIQRGTKVDNLVQIGHNVTVGENAILAGQVGIAGSVQVGRGVVLAGQVGIANHVRIGDGAIVGSKSGVAQDIPQGEVMSGYPAMPHKGWLRSSQAFVRLPELLKRVRALERKVESLEKEIHGRETD